MVTRSTPAFSMISDDLDEVLVDFLSGADEHFVGERIEDVLERDASEDAVAEALDDLAPFDERRDVDAV
jgi:hypothetical protein